MSNRNCKDGYFVITRLHRLDLEDAGFDTTNVTDDMMEQLAELMNDDYLSHLFWEHLPVFAESLGIPEREQ